LLHQHQPHGDVTHFAASPRRPYSEYVTGDLTQFFGNLAVELQSEPDSEATLQAIVTSASTTVPGARWSEVSLIRGNIVDSRAPSDPIVAELDALQNDLNDGPCLDALRERHTVHIADMESDSRWPRFAKAAAHRGIGSLLSFQLFVRGTNLGALTIYGDKPGAFTDESTRIGEVFAQHASVALISAESKRHFDSALASRDIIGQAKGILMQRNRLTAIEAFRSLVDASQQTNMKLADVATWLAQEHESRVQAERDG